MPAANLCCYSALLATASEVGQIVDKSNRPPNETILQTVLKFQFDHTCFNGEEVSVVV